jgi:hypothetical protein
MHKNAAAMMAYLPSVPCLLFSMNVFSLSKEEETLHSPSLALLDETA